MTRLVKLHQQRVRLECNLAPLASARYRDRRQPSGGSSVHVGVPTVRHKLPGEAKARRVTLDVGENGNGDINLGSSLQDGAMIDETPARAVMKDRLSQLRPARNSLGLGLSLDTQIDSQIGAEPAELGATDTELVSRAEPESESGGGIESIGGDNEQLYLSPADQDSVELILWYHSSKSAIKPIYTLDARQSFSGENSLQAQHQYNLARLSPKLETDKDKETETETETSLDRDENEDSAESPGKQLNYSTKNTGSDTTKSGNLSLSPALSASDRFTATNQKLTAGVTSRNAKHFAMAKLSSRIRFRISSRKAKAYLIIDKLEASDAGEYKCRVDFKYARTQYQLTRLQVIGKYLRRVRLADSVGQ